MNRIPLSLPEIGLIAGTRAAAGAGIAFLLSSRLKENQRRAVGWTLLAVGVITTIPIAIELVKTLRATKGGSGGSGGRGAGGGGSGGGSNGHVGGRMSHRKEHA